MTMTQDRPAFRLTEADAPTGCPDWCEGHTASYAESFGTFDTLSAYQDARATFRAHNVQAPEDEAEVGSGWWTLLTYQDGFDAPLLDLEVSGTDHVETLTMTLTPTQARALALRLLVRSAQVEDA